MGAIGEVGAQDFEELHVAQASTAFPVAPLGAIAKAVRAQDIGVQTEDVWSPDCKPQLPRACPGLVLAHLDFSLDNIDLTDEFKSGGCIPALSSVPIEYELDVMNDSGAGRTFGSGEELARQGVPQSALKQYTRPSPNPLTFSTANGPADSKKSIGLSSGDIMGNNRECYILRDSPFCVSMGQTVQEQRMPFIWTLGDLPYHVTDYTKLAIQCPKKYRCYADRVEENVPYWKVKVKLGFAGGRPPGTFLHNASPGVFQQGGASGSGAPPPLAAPPGPPPGLEDVVADPVETLDEVLCEPCLSGEEAGPLADFTNPVRSMSKSALMAEKDTLWHKMCHQPHNPYCEVCIAANMMGRRFHRTTPGEDDGLPKVCAPCTQLASDHIILAVADQGKGSKRKSASGYRSIHVIRDFYSGMMVAIPMKSSTKDKCYKHLKWFVGVRSNNPNIIVKSDNAGDIVEAVNDLGWHSEPSLADTWPHNTSLERHNGLLKCSMRGALFQSGVPEEHWDVVAEYAAIAFSVNKSCPILPWERDPTSGNILDKFKHKQSLTCWQCYHGGDDFPGPMQPFGRLIMYKDKSSHPLGATTSYGFFVGWRLEAGLRYRGMLRVLDYERAKNSKFSIDDCVLVSEKEIYWLAQLEFPFAVKRWENIKKLGDQSEIHALPPPTLFLEDEAPAPLAIEDKLPGIFNRPRFLITWTVLKDYGFTKGCPKCDDYPYGPKSHTDECRKRLEKALLDAGKLAPEPQDAVEDIPHPMDNLDLNDEDAAIVHRMAGSDPDPSAEAPLGTFAVGKGDVAGSPAAPEEERQKVVKAVASKKAKAQKAQLLVEGLEIEPKPPPGPPNIGVQIPPNFNDKGPNFDATGGDWSGKSYRLDMQDYCKDAINHYLQVTGLSKLKRASHHSAQRDR